MKLRNQRKILLGVLALFVSLVFAACGNSTDSSSTNNSSNTSKNNVKEVKKEMTRKTINNVEYIVLDSYIENLIKDDVVKAEELEHQKILLTGKIDNIESKNMFEYRITVAYEGYKRSVDLTKTDDEDLKSKLKKGNKITIGATFFQLKGDVIDFADQTILSAE